VTTTSVSLLPVTAATFVPSALHAADRDWTETNCYVDLWIEVLSSLGLDPGAAGACTLSARFEGDQWTFLKYPPEDLRALYGVEVSELNVWRPVLDHVVEHLRLGNLLTVEVDGWYLPDTAGASYRTEHVKTTIVPQEVDVEGRRLGYFHNAGYFELSDDDFDGVFRLGRTFDADVLPPYVELVRLDRARRDDAGLPDRVRALVGDHLARRPDGNPVADLGERVQADAAWLAAEGLETFHKYAFGTLRQCGSTAELASDFCDWLSAHAGAGLDDAAADFRAVSQGMKTVQLQAARLARGRTVDLATPFAALAERWASAVGRVEEWHRQA
jgi:hypothetical protein